AARAPSKKRRAAKSWRYDSKSSGCESKNLDRAIESINAIEFHQPVQL
ncbi:MAG: hypothetical protein F6K28_51135, partial [Microcoleus sp. SIO2G3]|nr:hypothetical protein [Microcoleus sp. SIO2G3]